KDVVQRWLRWGFTVPSGGQAPSPVRGGSALNLILRRASPAQDDKHAVILRRADAEGSGRWWAHFVPLPILSYLFRKYGKRGLQEHSRRRCRFHRAAADVLRRHVAALGRRPHQPLSERCRLVSHLVAHARR